MAKFLMSSMLFLISEFFIFVFEDEKLNTSNIEGVDD